MDGGIELRENRGLRDRNVMRAEDEFGFWRERSKFFYRREVGGEVGFRAIQPDFSGIESVSGEEESVGAIDEGNGIWRVAGSGDDFDGAAAEIDFEVVMDE